MNGTNKTTEITVAIDAMGGDNGPAVVVEGASRAITRGLTANILFVGDRDVLAPLIEKHRNLARAEIMHAGDVVAMTDKPMHVVRRAHETSMWKAVDAVKAGAADAVVSCGNTGALMAVSLFQLKKIAGNDPARTHGCARCGRQCGSG